MPINYDAIRAQRFAKRHKRVAQSLTAPLEKTVAEKSELIETLKAENEKLAAENEKLKAENEKLAAENEKLAAENEKLKAEKKSSTATSSAKAKGKG